MPNLVKWEAGGQWRSCTEMCLCIDEILNSNSKTKQVFLSKCCTYLSVVKYLLSWFLKDTDSECRMAHLSKLLDVAEFQVGDDEENDRHNSQSHVILPQSPRGVLQSQVVQILLSCASEITQFQTGQALEEHDKDTVGAWSLQIYLRQSSCAHTAVAHHSRHVDASDHRLLAELQTHKFIDLQGLDTDRGNICWAGEESESWIAWRDRTFQRTTYLLLTPKTRQWVVGSNADLILVLFCSIVLTEAKYKSFMAILFTFNS